VPQGFNYQAIARDGSGTILANLALPVKIDIQTSLTGGTLIYEELFASVTSNSFGLISLVVGTGTQTGGSAASFSAIDWKAQTLYLKTIIQYPGTTWTTMGTSQIWAVPYSLVSKEVTGPLTKLGITGTTTDMEEALFEVKNHAGNTVFAVYNEGIRAYVGDGSAKGTKGGFSVGGYDATKGSTYDLFTLNTDSARLYFDTKPNLKGKKGGFSVGGYDMTKGGTVVQDMLDVSKDSVRVYVDSNPATKGVRGGFSVGGYDMTKGGSSISNYLNIETNSTGIVNPAENRILWYPLKNAFLTGRVLITDPANVGQQSFATGYEPMASGDYSQAMGFQPVASGAYSTAIGKNALANKLNSFAFGDHPQATGQDSYAFGAGAIASGTGSFSFGSVGRDTTTFASTGIYTTALGNYSFALGQGSQSNGIGSVSFGLNNISSRDYAISIGYNNQSSGYLSSSFGALNIASGSYSTALGTYAKASGNTSLAIGTDAIAAGSGSIAIGQDVVIIGPNSWNAPLEADGARSVAIGTGVTASSYASFVVGQQNAIPSSYSSGSWVPTDPLFVIGNGNGGNHSIGPYRSNAMTVLKNGNVGLGTSTPSAKLEVWQVNGTGVSSLSGWDGYYVSDAIGRSAEEGRLSICAAAGQFSTSSNPGDVVLRVDDNTKQVCIVAGAGDASLIVTSGNVYLPNVPTVTSSPTYYLGLNGSTIVKHLNTSSIRYKRDVIDMEDISWLYNLRPVNFIYKSDFSGHKRYGLIAEEVEKINQSLVGYNEKGEVESVDYSSLISPLLKSAQDQELKIATLSNENQQLKSEIQTLKEEVSQIKAMLVK